MAARPGLLPGDWARLRAAAFCAAALSIDVCPGTDAFLDARVHDARRQGGQGRAGGRLRALIAHSQIIPSHLHDDARVQDPYSWRCAPQVMGAVLDALRFARQIVERELDAVTDNPLVFAKSAGHARQVVSAGNFHGMPLALALDTAIVAMTYLGG